VQAGYSAAKDTSFGTPTLSEQAEGNIGYGDIAKRI
jgi:hypothetical protein